MGQELFLHSFFAQSAKFRSEMVKLIRDRMVEFSHTNARKIVLVAIDKAQEMITAAPSGIYIDAQGNYRIPFGIRAPEEWDSISTADLINGLEIVEVVDPGNDPGAPATAQVLDSLAGREEEKELIGTLLAAKVEDFQRSMLAKDASIPHTPEMVICGWAEHFDILHVRKFMSRLSKSFFRRCLRTSTDGTRVSREVHEYDYCVKSGQLQDMITYASRWSGNYGTGSTLEDEGLSENAQDYTYGNFVDLHFGRKAIAAIRKVRRSLRRANVKSVLELTNNDIVLLENTLLENINMNDAFEELKALGVTATP